MHQLKMNWINDGKVSDFTPPKDVKVVNFTELENALSVWLEMMQYLSNEQDETLQEEYYHANMTAIEHYRESDCMFLCIDGVPAATITVICNEETKNGYVHMVAAKPQFRGRGLGHLLSRLAVHTLKQRGMKDAYLRTDDWRIPAIKTYLAVGFMPDRETYPEYKERWEAIDRILKGE